jgi:uncharacterized membrane protein YesL
VKKNILDSSLYRYMDIIAAFLVLNLAWLVACLPVITVYPATAAMFAVAREWVKKKEFDGTLRDFISFFKKDFKQSFWIGIVWTFFGAVLFVNSRLIDNMPDILQVPFYVCFLVAGFVYLTASVFLLPVLVNYATSWQRILKTSVLLSLSRLPTTIGCLAVLAASVAVIRVLPITILISCSVASYAIYWLCERSFQKVAASRCDGGESFGP